MLIHSHTIFFTPPSLLLLLLLSLSLFLLLLWARDSWRCPLIWLLPDSDTQQLDVECLPLVPSKDRHNAQVMQRHTLTQTEYWDGNVLCQHCRCDPQSMLRVYACVYGCERMSKYESEIEKEINPRWLPCYLPLKPKRSTLHYTAWHFYGCVYIWFVKVTQSKCLITFNPKNPDVTQATGHPR